MATKKQMIRELAEVISDVVIIEALQLSYKSVREALSDARSNLKMAKQFVMKGADE